MLADFGRAAALGFQTGQQMGEGQNPLGQFVRMMLADWQNKRQVAGEYEMKKGLIGEEAGVARAEEQRKEKSPLYQAQTNAYEALGTQRTEGLIDEEIKKDAWAKYKEGDRSPETLKSLGKWVSPMEQMFAQSMGFGGTPGIESTNIPTGKLPKYNPKTQKLQYNEKTGQWRVTPK